MSATSADKPVAPADRASAPAFAACRFALVSMIELADPLGFVSARRSTQRGGDVRLCEQNVNRRILFPKGFFPALQTGRASRRPHVPDSISPKRTQCLPSQRMSCICLTA